MSNGAILFPDYSGGHPEAMHVLKSYCHTPKKKKNYCQLLKKSLYKSRFSRETETTGWSECVCVCVCVCVLQRMAHLIMEDDKTKAAV